MPRSEFVQIIVGHDPIAALVQARSLAREGFDTSETQEAAIAALTPKNRNDMTAPRIAGDERRRA